MFLPSKFPSRAHPPVAERPLDRVGSQPRLGERLAALRLIPDVEAALLALGVGVERGVEAALWTAHFAQDPFERLLADPPPALLFHHLPAVQIDRARSALSYSIFSKWGTSQAASTE